MRKFSELAREWLILGHGHLLYGSIKANLPYELWIRGYDLLVAWRDDYPPPRSEEFAWALVKDGDVIKEWDRCPSLSDLREVTRELCEVVK